MKFPPAVTPDLSLPSDGDATLDALARRAAELEVVAQVSLAVTTILNSAELLQTVVDLSRNALGCGW